MRSLKQNNKIRNISIPNLSTLLRSSTPTVEHTSTNKENKKCPSSAKELHFKIYLT